MKRLIYKAIDDLATLAVMFLGLMIIIAGIGGVISWAVETIPTFWIIALFPIELFVIAVKLERGTL